MKRILNTLPAVCLLGSLIFLLSCSDNSAQPGDGSSKPVEEDRMEATGQSKDQAFIPFDMAVITHDVKDYKTWRPFFDTDAVSRKASGLEDIMVGKGSDKPNSIVIMLRVGDLEKAKQFVADPRLKNVMEKGGVVSKPEIQFYRVVRHNAEARQKQWVTVTHKVKDYDAWLKVYDGEGNAQRNSEGMVDLLLARGTDDPNLVQLVFKITDMTKAKTAIFSEAKKQLMMSAGVEGKPAIEFYSSAE
jgi:hypothetical protein